MARKTDRILFSATYFDSGLPKWEAGKHYAVSEETERQVTAGIAEKIKVDAEEAEQVDLDLDKNPDGDVAAAAGAPDAAV